MATNKKTKKTAKAAAMTLLFKGFCGKVLIVALAVIILFVLGMISFSIMDSITHDLWMTSKDIATTFLEGASNYIRSMGWDGGAKWVEGMIDKYLQDLTPEQKAMAKRRDLYEKVCEKANKGLKKYDTIAESHLLEWGILAAIDTLFITDLEFEEIDGEIVPSDTKYDVNTLANDLKTEVKETRTFTDIIYHYTLKDEYKLPADVSYQSNHTIDHGDKSGKRANNIKMLLSANDKETLLHELNATTEKVAYQYCNECEKEWKKGDPIPEGCLGMTPLSIVTGHIIRTKYIDEAVPVKLPQTYTIEKSRLGSFDTYPCTATYKVKADEKTIFSKSFVIGESVIQDKELESIQDSFNPEYYDIEEEKIQITYPTVIDTFRGTYNYCFYQSEEDPETVSNQTVRNYTLPSEVTIYKAHDLSDALHDTQDYVRLRRALIKYAKIGDKLSEELPDYLHKGMQKVNGSVYSPVGGNYTLAEYRPTDLVYFGYENVTEGSGIIRIRKTVKDAFDAMCQAAKENNTKISVSKGYVSLQQQVEIKADNPGQSIYQLGTVIDIDGGKTWLKTNAIDHGFILIKNNTYRFIPDSDKYVSSGKSFDDYIKSCYEENDGTYTEIVDLTEEERIAHYAHKAISNEDIEIILAWGDNITQGRLFSDSSVSCFKGKGDLTWPVRIDARYAQVITDGFGSRGKTHTGLDIWDQALWGTPLMACTEGTVTLWGGSGSGAGFALTITDSDGIQYRYLHMDSARPYSPQSLSGSVREGDIVGYMGNTGHVSGVTGVHLHFDIIYSGKDLPDLSPDDKIVRESGTFLNPCLFLEKPEHVTIPDKRGANYTPWSDP